MKVMAVILAGGVGERFGADRPKGFVPLRGKPLLLWAVEAMEAAGEIRGGVLVVPQGYQGEAREALSGARKPWGVVDGGSSRQESALKGLEALEAEGPDYVLIHDAARPLLREELLRRILDHAPQAVLPVIRATDALLEGDWPWASRYLDRERAYLVQTPQGFPFRGILEAHRKALESGIADAPDDGSLYLAQGHRVRLVRGDRLNLKVTYPEDIAVLEGILEALRR